MKAKADVLIENGPTFLEGEDAQREDLIPGLIHKRTITLLSGDPRSMKSLFASEVLIACGTGTPAFNLKQFKPPKKMIVWRVAQEDDRNEERKRFRGLLRGRGIEKWPTNLLFSIHKRLNLDDSDTQERIINEIRLHKIELVCFDPLRSLTETADMGPQYTKKVADFFRRIVVETGCTVLLVHHIRKETEGFTKRGNKVSGGGWWAISECPISLEKAAPNVSRVVPYSYKYSSDPEAFKIFFTSNEYTISLIGQTDEEKESTPDYQKLILDYLRKNPEQSGSTIAKDIKRKKDAVLSTLATMKSLNLLTFKIGKANAHLWSLVETQS